MSIPISKVFFGFHPNSSFILELSIAYLLSCPNLSSICLIKLKDCPSVLFNFLSSFSSRNKSVDLAGFIIYDQNNIPCFSFGKHKGKSVDFIIENEPGYFGWLLNADFPMYTKKILTKLRLSKLNNKL